MLKLVFLAVILLCSCISFSKNHPENDSVWTGKVIICHFEANVFPRPVNLLEVEKSIIYPVSAVENDIEALVFVKVLVGRDGSVEKKEFTGNEVFKDEVLDKIGNLRFTPAISASKPVKYYVTVPFRFELRDK